MELAEKCRQCTLAIIADRPEFSPIHFFEACDFCIGQLNASSRFQSLQYLDNPGARVVVANKRQLSLVSAFTYE